MYKLSFDRRKDEYGIRRTMYIPIFYIHKMNTFLELKNGYVKKTGINRNHQ